MVTKKKIFSNATLRQLVSRLINLRRHAVTDDSHEALKIIKEYINIKTIEIKSGSKCWDWEIPPKWSVKKAKILYKGKKIFSDSEHIMAIQPYCMPFKGKVDLNELLKHIIFNKKKPHAYAYNCKLAYRYPFEKDWLLSMPYKKVKKLQEGTYDVKIETSFNEGTMKIAEYTIKGETKNTIILLSDLCHPGQADDGIVGIAMWIKILKKLKEEKKLRYTYKFFTPTETIGSIAWLWKRKSIIKNIKAGIFLESIGNKKPLFCKLSHKKNHEIDELVKYIFNDKKKIYDFKEGVMNDELIFADTDFDIPMVSFQRFPYPEYHTSDDNLKCISNKSLDETYDKVLKLIKSIEANYTPVRVQKGPIYLSKHGLYHEIAASRDQYWTNWNLMNLLGQNKTILEISKELNIDFWELYEILEKYKKAGVIKIKS